MAAVSSDSMMYDFTMLSLLRYYVTTTITITTDTVYD